MKSLANDEKDKESSVGTASTIPDDLFVQAASSIQLSYPLC